VASAACLIICVIAQWLLERIMASLLHSSLRSFRAAASRGGVRWRL
jgi:hypothetical protein